jgi:hypothetical protein
LKCLPPVDIILSEVKLIRDILPKAKILRDTVLVYGYRGNFNIEGKEANEPNISMEAFHSSKYNKWWSLRIKSITPKNKRTDKSPQDFIISFLKGRPTNFIIGDNQENGNCLIIDSDFNYQAGNNRLQTMSLLEGHLDYITARLAEKVKNIKNN